MYCSMDDDPKEACRTAYNTLKDHCDQLVAGTLTLKEMRVIKVSRKDIDQLCTAACIDCNLETWLDRLDDVEKFIEKVQHFFNLLCLEVQGM